MNITKENYIKAANLVREKHQLRTVIWESTLKCSMNCLHCGSDCHKSSETPDMPREVFYKFIIDIKQMLGRQPFFVAISGGEPLMRKDLPEIGLFLKEQKLPWGIVSNGNELTPEMMSSLMSAGMKTMSISLDGLKASHEWLRGIKGSWQKAIEAIQMMADADLKKYDVITCVNQKNIIELDSIYALLQTMNVKKWRLITIFAKGRAKEHENLFLNPEQFNILMQFIQSKRQEGKMDVSYSCEAYLADYEYKVRDSHFFCRAGISVMAIRCDGSISGCLSLREGFDEGNLYKDDVKQLWHNGFKNYRNRSWAKTGDCAHCKDFDLCLGNSLHLRNNFDEKVVFCHKNHYLGSD